MYTSSRLLPVLPGSERTCDIVERLAGMECKLDDAIALKRLSAVESRLDVMLNQLEVEPDMTLHGLNSVPSKPNPTPIKAKAAKSAETSSKPTSIPLKKISTAKLTGKSAHGLDMVFQISSKAQPLLVLGVIKSLQLAGLNTIVRLHHHSSVIDIDEDAFLFRSLLTAFQIGIDTSVSRALADYDFVFTFILTNQLQGHDVDLTVSSSNATIFTDKTCARLLWKLAGGAFSGEGCNFWLDRVDEALTDIQQTDLVKKQILKQFNKSNGFLCDVAVSVLDGYNFRWRQM